MAKTIGVNLNDEQLAYLEKIYGKVDAKLLKKLIRFAVANLPEDKARGNPNFIKKV